MLRWYYAATPAFWLLDGVFDLPLRAAFLDTLPAARHIYYALCTAIGVVAFTSPRQAVTLAFAESVANIGFIILSVGVWYLGMLDWAGGPSAAVAVPTAFHLVNFALAALAAGVSYGLRRTRP